jgi:integrase
MASINERKKKDGTSTYQVFIRDKHLAPIVKTFPTRTQAEQFVFEINIKLKGSVPKPSKAGPDARMAKLLDVKMVDAIASFVASPDVKQRHLNIMPTIVKHIGDIKIGEIRKSWVKSFVKHMRNQVSRRMIPYADSSIAAMIWTMNVVAKWKADELDVPHQNLALGIMDLNGTWDVKRERRLEPKEEVAILERLSRIESSNREHWKLIFLLSLETAARLQELFGAQWSEFDLERRVWMLPSKRTKGKKTRAIPLNNAALDILKRMEEIRSTSSTRVFHALGTKTHCMSACFHRYVKQADVKDFRFHDLRHEAVSRMALYWRQFSMFELMVITGHTRMEMFQRYANLRADELADRFIIHKP